MSSIDFLGADPIKTADDLERLAFDLRNLASGTLPQAEELASAPTLMRWSFVPRVRYALNGSVQGHPFRGDGRPVVTSELFAIDRERHWARTLSRFYALGSPLLMGLDGQPLLPPNEAIN